MVYRINDNCMGCGSCEAVCVNEAVYEGDDKFEIDPAKCIGCGICAEDCPMSAIEPD